jgi:serine/threonine protein kinase
MANKPPGLKIGGKLRKYEILGILGQGGMGIVYKAHDPDINMDVAIKWMDASNAPDPLQMAESFRQEAQTYARLSHTGLVQYRDFIIEKTNLYMVTALVEGVTLDMYVRSHGYFTEPAAARLVISILQALSYAHEKGVIHRDLKPANIMIQSDGTPVILDFGISKAGGASAHTQFIAAQAYSLHYASPEQIAMISPDIHTSAASDIYSIGVMISEIVAGLVEKKIIPENAAQRLIRDTVTSLPGLSSGMQSVVMRAIRPFPTDRYQSASEMILALAPIAGVSQSPVIPPVVSSSPNQSHSSADALQQARTLMQKRTTFGRNEHDIRRDSKK